MRKSLCLLIAIAVMMSCTLNAFAYAPVGDGTVYTKPEKSSPLKADSGVDDTHTSWEFKSPTGFYYTVIPDASADGVDDDGNSEKQYFVVSNTYYGKIPGYANLTERGNWIFDPEIDGGYAYWLNNEFLSGVSAEKHDNCEGNSLDEGIVGYLRAHDWYVEGYGPSTSGKENVDAKYHYDYYANAKVALLSTAEFMKYGKYMKQSLKFANGKPVPSSANYSCLLRSFATLGGSNTGAWVKRYVQSSGNTGNCGTFYCGVRPCFYVSEKYFKENRLTEYGDYVASVIKENNTRDSLKELGYSDNEISLICTDASLTLDSVTVLGDGIVGSELSVSAVYSDGVEEKCDTSAAIIKWYASAAKNGDYSKIDGANGSVYIIDASNGGKYIKASVTPVSLDGSYGIEKMSDNAVKAKGSVNAVIPSTLTPTSDFSTNNGRVSPQRSENEFVYNGDDGEFVYSLLDTATIGGDTAFLVYSNDNYGDASTVSGIFHTNNTFNPDDKTNIAHWLNNEFLNGEGNAQNGNKSVFDRKAAEYALVNDWYVEGNGKGDDVHYKTTSVTQNDYTARCKIALLSYSEYVKYQGKIGYKSTSTIAASGDRVLMRSPNTNTFLSMKFYGSGSGNVSHQNVANELNSDGSVKAEYSFICITNPVVIRPVMYLSVDYFKNAKLAKAGENVKKTIRENIPKNELLGLYTEDELVSILGYSSDSTDVSDAVVYGIAAAGETLGVYYDESTLPENAKVTVRWYVSDSADDAGKQEFEGIRCTIPSYYEGKHITAHFDVTDSASGEKLKSEEIYVGKVRSAQSVSAVYTVVDDRNVSFTIKNTSGDDTKTARTIVAAFDENNVMLGIESKLYSLSAAVTDKITINEVNNAAFYRILILNADDNSPLCALTLR